MSGTSELTKLKRTALIWEGLKQFLVLPDWLDVARDPDRVRESLARVVPEFISGQLLLEGCDVGHMRYKVDSWSGVYDLTIREAGQAEAREVALQGTIYSPGVSISAPTIPESAFESKTWRVYLPDLNLLLAMPGPEKVLTSLEFLTDPGQACQYLERSIRADSPAYRDLQIQACTPKVVRYKPGSRCTILYNLEYLPEVSQNGHWPDLVVAKTYRTDKGQNAYEGMRALWNSPLASGKIVTIAEPLAYDPEMRVLVQGPIREEQTLKNLMNWAIGTNTPEALEMLDIAMRKTAAGLAALHNTRIQPSQVWTWENELDEIRDRVDRLSTNIPQFGGAAEPLLARLIELANTSPPDPLVPSHGSFRPAQVLLYQGQVGFIDFDSFSLSEQANDLALFLCTVKSIGMDTTGYGGSSAKPLEGTARQARLEQMQALYDAFLDEYEKYHPVSRLRVALWETLDIFMLVLQSWIKVKTFRLQDSTFLLEDCLHRLGV
jgi:hypothetical protein